MTITKEFFLDFMNPFFGGLLKIFKALLDGLLEMFDVTKYADIIKEYASDFDGFGWFVVILSIIILLSFIFLIVFIIVRLIRRKMKFRKNVEKQDDMENEIEDLNAEVIKLKEENKKFLAMADPENGEVEYDENGNIINKLKSGESRFFKLSKIDEDMEKFEFPPVNNSVTLKEFCDAFRNYSANKLKLYYNEKIIRLFVSSLASNRLIILQGISGTGKTSLAYAFGDLIDNETVIASVQPSWRDSSELFGYFNEFTKRFNETEVLSKIYEASFKDEVYLTLLDEMNISRVEYYFAEMLSILELPVKSEWIIELVPNVWEKDPKKLIEGKLQIPDNMWYIGTINNDDSTFMVTDKVYDRAMPINIDEKSEAFEAPETNQVRISAKHLVKLFESAKEKNPLSEKTLQNVQKFDDYIRIHFRVAFGNRILKQMKDFVPVYVECGGKEEEAVDYIIANKILRKFEQLNLSYITDEIDPFIKFLEELFGKDNIYECREYLLRLKKMI